MQPQAVQIGTVEVLVARTYYLDAHAKDAEMTAVVEPGVYPLYESGMTRFWVMDGLLNFGGGGLLRMGDGMFVHKPYDDPVDVGVRFPSKFYGPDEWKVLIRGPLCVEGSPEQRLRVKVEQ